VRRRSVKRTTIRILLVLILGVVTTFGVAWGCMITRLLPDTSGTQGYAFEGGTNAGWWIGSVEVGFGWRSCALYTDLPWITGGRVTPEPLPDWIDQSTPHPPLLEGEVTAQVTCGWPNLCLTAQQRGTDNTEAYIARGGPVQPGVGAQEVLWDAWDHAINLSPQDRAFTRRFAAIPLGIIWPAFLMNVVLYTSAWLALWLLTFGARRFVRFSRGRCVTCGYDLRGQTDNACSECGRGRIRDSY